MVDAMSRTSVTEDMKAWHVVAIVLSVALGAAAGMHAASWVGCERARQSVECAKNPAAVWNKDGYCERIAE